MNDFKLWWTHFVEDFSYSWTFGLFELEIFWKFSRYVFSCNNINFCFVFKTPMFRFWLKYVIYFFHGTLLRANISYQNSSHRIRSRPYRFYIPFWVLLSEECKIFKLDKQQRNNKSAENRKIDCQVTSLKLI